MKSNGLDYTALVITVIGALNWTVPFQSGYLPVRRHDMAFKDRICHRRNLRTLSAEPLRKDYFYG